MNPASPTEEKSSSPWWTKALHVLVPIALALTWSVAYLSQELKNLDELFDSDGLTLELMWVDIFQNGGRWADWYPPHAPRFLPDMALYFGARELTPDAYWAIFLFGLVLLFLVYLPAVWLAGLLGESRAAVTLTQTTILSVVAFLAVEGVRPYSFTYAATFHTGILIHGLLLVIFYTYLRRNPSAVWPWIALSTLTILGSASDLLFVITYLAPFCAVLLLDRLFGGPNCNLRLVPLVAGGVVFGIFIKNQLIRDTMPDYFDFSRSIEKAWLIPANFIGMFERAPLTSSLCVLFYLLLLAQTIGWLLARFKEGRDLKEPFPFWQATFLLSAIVILLAVGIRGLCEPIYLPTIKDSRLLITIPFNAILMPWLPIKQRLKQNDLPIAFALSLALVAVLVKFNPFAHSYHARYRPLWIAEIDRRITEYEKASGRKLYCGVSSYWPTKATLALSRHKLQIGQYTPTLDRYYCLNNTTWYCDKYDFAILEYTEDDKIFYENLIHSSGQPEKVYRCDDLILLIFPPSALDPKNFQVDLWKMRPGPTVKSLPTNNALYSPADDQNDHIIIFGPYARLEEGSYIVSLDFKVGTQQVPGTFRCEVYMSEEGLVVQEKRVELPVEESHLNIQLPFEISSERAYSPIEFRIWKDGAFDLSLVGIQLKESAP